MVGGHGSVRVVERRPAHGVFAGGAPIESFAGWQPGTTYIFAFPASALVGAAFADGAVENFKTWTTKNPTLG